MSTAVLWILWKEGERMGGLDQLAKLKENLIAEEKKKGVYVEPSPAKPRPRHEEPRRNFAKPTGQSRGNGKDPQLGGARAPYNFVPLNKKVVSAQCTKEEFGAFSHGKELYSGLIHYELTALTPLFIRGKDSEFFAPAGRPVIPGSTMRGMARNLVKIASFGSMIPGEDVQDSTYYYRAFADLCKPYRDYYMNNIRTEKMKDGKRYSEVHAQAGFLVKEDEQYYIIPALQTTPKGYRRERILQGRRDEPGPRWRNEEVVLISGHMHNKKWNNCLYLPDRNAERIAVSETDIENYRADVSRKGFDILKYLENKKEQQGLRQKKLAYLQGIRGAVSPCFYVEWNDRQERKRVAFGNTTYFRLAFRTSVGDHVPDELKDTEVLDLAGAIFGQKGLFASRVFFDDAELLDEKLTVLPETYLKPLLSPKATTFQHYLEQGNAAFCSDLKHWDNAANLRGYKQYWHRKTARTEWAKDSPTVAGEKKAAPLAPGSRFSGCIRFERLSEVELGALLFVLALPEGCAHKIGMGKPLGFGSVRMQVSLELCEPKERYTQLFAEKAWCEGLRGGTTADFQQRFEAYVLQQLQQLQETQRSSLWEHERLRELRCLLDWTLAEKQGWNDRTRYMEIERVKQGNNGTNKENEYKERPVLPKPSQVAKKS